MGMGRPHSHRRRLLLVRQCFHKKSMQGNYEIHKYVKATKHRAFVVILIVISTFLMLFIAILFFLRVKHSGGT
jgi:hypothetical protein